MDKPLIIVLVITLGSLIASTLIIARNPDEGARWTVLLVDVATLLLVGGALMYYYADVYPIIYGR